MKIEVTKELLGKTVLVQVDNSIFCTGIYRFSPSGKYVHLYSECLAHTSLGWKDVNDVMILEVL